MSRGMLQKCKRALAIRLATLVRGAQDEVARRSLPKFANEPKNLRIEEPSRLINTRFMHIGDDVSLGPGCMLNAIRRYPGRFFAGVPDDIETQEFTPSISIGHRVSATGYLTIGAASSVTIEDDALLASHIFISDNRHGYSRIDVPYKYQPLEGIADVVIGRGCWIGEHVVVMPGVTIGANSIVGANSVVTKSIPQRSIAVGSPAAVIRRWCEKEEGWVAVDQMAG